MAFTPNMQCIKDFMGLQVCEKNTFLHVVKPIDDVYKPRSSSAPPCTRQRVSAFELTAETKSHAMACTEERTELSNDLEWLNNNDVLTLMIKNIPCSCRRDDILAAIDEVGFKQTHDFFYVPTRRNKCLGYAFISFPAPQLAQEFARAMSGYQFKNSLSGKKAIIAPANLQGFRENLKHFRSTAVMHTCAKPLFKGRRAYETFS
jgi:hypothetical protein